MSALGILNGGEGGKSYSSASHNGRQFVVMKNISVSI